MARTNNLTNFLTDVAGAIKEKKGSETDIPAANFDTEIRNLPSQGIYQEKSVTIYANGTQTIEPDTGYDAISELEITTQVPDKQLQTKNYEFTTNGNVTLEPDTGYDGFSSIGLNIAVPSGDYNVKVDMTKYGGTSQIQGYITGLKDFELIEFRGNLTNFFAYCGNLTTIPKLNTSNVENMSGMFSYCIGLISIPQLDTSKVTNFSNIFNGCTNLTTIPYLNTTRASIMNTMFFGCKNLSNESLNNILLMCINATSYTSIKTLKHIGLRDTNYPVSQIEALSNYQAFLNAGWTIGY